MFFNRNVQYIKDNGRVFLESLGFEVIGQDWYGFNVYGGIVSFIVKEKANPNALYCVWVISWFGQLQVDSIKAQSPVNISTVPQ